MTRRASPSRESSHKYLPPDTKTGGISNGDYMITFHISDNLNHLHESEAVLSYPDWKPPSKEELESRRDTYENIWSEVGSPIMAKMEELTGLQFEPHIECYVLSGSLRDHSRPLVLKSRYTRDEFIARMSHELTHRLFSGSDHKPLPYQDEPRNVRSHIYTYALLSKVLTPEQLAIERAVKTEEYQRAWKIVDRDGVDAVLAQLH